MTTAQATERETTLDSIYHRRAVRHYTPEAVDEQTIRSLLDAAVHAPTAMHMEPWAFVVVQDKAMLKRLSDRAKELAHPAADAHKLHEVPGAAGRGRGRDVLADPAFNIFYNAGTLIVICAKPLGSFVSADCWLAAENLMLAAHASGLGSCPIGFALPVLNTPEAKHDLGIPLDDTAVAAVIVGHEQGSAPDVPRKPAVILSWLR